MNCKTQVIYGRPKFHAALEKRWRKNCLYSAYGAYKARIFIYEQSKWFQILLGNNLWNLSIGIK